MTKQPQDRKRSFDDVLAQARPAQRSVTICLAGDLNVQVEELDQQLSRELKSTHASLGSSGREREIAEQIEALREQMAEHEVTFTFRALSARKWSDLMAAHPGRPGKDEAFNTETFPDAMLAACAVEPEMTVEQVTSLADSLGNAEFSALFDCAWSCNQKSLDVPFSVLASRVLRESETS